MSLKYFVIDVGDAQSPQYSISVESPETVRKNLAGTQLILKTDSSDPTAIGQPFYDKTALTHEQAKTLVATSEWQNNI
jgi:hypothetical protein